MIPDLVLLDLGLPDVDGVDLCREFRRQRPAASIIVLTARQEEADVVVGLEPVPTTTSPSRSGSRNCWRESAHTCAGPRPQATVELLTAGDVEVDVAARRAWAGRRGSHCGRAEFDLLVLLTAEARATRVTRERIMDEVWDENWYGLHQDPRCPHLGLAAQAE